MLSYWDLLLPGWVSHRRERDGHGDCRRRWDEQGLQFVLLSSGLLVLLVANWSPNSTYLHLDFYLLSTDKYKRQSRAICYPARRGQWPKVRVDCLAHVFQPVTFTCLNCRDWSNKALSKDIWDLTIPNGVVFSIFSRQFSRKSWDLVIPTGVVFSDIFLLWRQQMSALVTQHLWAETSNPILRIPRIKNEAPYYLWVKLLEQIMSFLNS